MTWSFQQDRALIEIDKWLRAKDRQVFRLFGAAGTGKSTIASAIGREIPGVAFCAFTGKAAAVLRSYKCSPATTIHQLIYHPIREGDHVVFARKSRIDAKLIILDEASMVDSEIAQDLLSYNVPILTIADPFQLPPVNDEMSFFTHDEPDVMLTEIHRQAADNPILRIATDIRNGGDLPRAPYTTDERFSIVNDVDPNAYDIILCGKNATRHAWNRSMRRRKGYARASDSLRAPQIGEPVVCLHNDYRVDMPVFNGTTWKIDHVESIGVRVRGETTECYRLDLSSPDEGKTTVRVPCRYFGKDTPQDEDKSILAGLQQFDYGYCLTVHKAQGSEYISVLLQNEAKVFRHMWRRWLYTGLTRARERLTIVDYG